MPVHANDVRLVRVYTRGEEGRVFDDTLSRDKRIEVIVEAKAGATIFGDGARYLLQIVVRDLTDFTIVCKERLTGHFGDERWKQPELMIAFTIPEQGITKKGHVYEVLTSLMVGIANPNVSFVKSPMFIIY